MSERPAPIFWVDPREEVVALFLTQMLPSSTYPIRSQLNQLVQQALVDSIVTSGVRRPEMYSAAADYNTGQTPVVIRGCW